MASRENQETGRVSWVSGTLGRRARMPEMPSSSVIRWLGSVVVLRTQCCMLTVRGTSAGSRTGVVRDAWWVRDRDWVGVSSGLSAGRNEALMQRWESDRWVSAEVPEVWTCSQR